MCIRVIPRIDQTHGMTLVGLIQKQSSFEVFEQQMSSASLFLVLADFNHRIVHTSQNCIDVLDFVDFIAQHDLALQQLFKGLPDDLQHQGVYTCTLDTTVLRTYSNNAASNDNFRTYTIRVQY